MEVKYDMEKIQLSAKFRIILRELMLAELEMMREMQPESVHCWTWGECVIKDLANIHPFEFRYGGDEDFPEGFPLGEIVRIIGEAPEEVGYGGCYVDLGANSTCEWCHRRYCACTRRLYAQDFREQNLALYHSSVLPSE